MSAASRGGELFIVDNSDTDWKGLRYLQDWTEIASAFDIATGFFEIGALLALDGKWQKLDRIRILMGGQTTARTRQAILEGLRRHVREKLDGSLEREKESNDFLGGARAIVEAMKAGKIQCRVYAKRKFHAKAYITHPRVAVIGSVALVGSSNFTVPGLTENVELNIQIRAPGDVARLQEWYEQHWQEAEEVMPDVIRVIERHIDEYPPFEVYAKALQELFEHHTPTEAEWENGASKMYPVLDHYQKEGYHSLLNIARQHNGAFLCDGVGLGKTFVGLMLIERLVMHDKKRVVLLVPKSGRVAVWERSIRRYLPHLLNGFLPFKIYNHTDLMRGPSGDGRDFPAEFQQIKEQADVVLIDEAHHFRNRGLANAEDGTIRSRYWQLYDIIGQKTVFLLTATPVNNALTDFQHEIELFSRVDNPTAFAGALGIHNLASHFQQLEKALKRLTAGEEHGELFQVNQAEAEKVLFDDKLFRSLVVQRSRAYAQQSQLQHGGTQAMFPTKEPPKVQPYSVKKTYGHLLGKVEAAFSKPDQLFSLAVYYPLGHWIGDPSALRSFDVNRQKQVVRLIRIQFLKRFESSIYAFETSCQNLLLKLLAFLRKNSTTPTEVKRLHRWEAQNAELLEHVKERRSELQEEDESEEADTSELGDEFLDDFEELSRTDYNLPEIFDETYADLEQLVDFLEELKTFNASHDNKLQSLIKLLKGDAVLKKQKVLIFSEFMATARYLRRELLKAGIEGVEEIDSASTIDRGDAIQRFAPYYNGSSSGELAAKGHKETRILISTDVLSEGLNLQDATRLINYDLHWNPVRLMQRIGRVDRRLNPEIEAKMVADHPDLKPLRGKVIYWNFLPPEDLDGLLRLYHRVSSKTLRISKVFGIEGRKLLKPEDDFDALKDFTHKYQGELTPLEKMHLEFQKLLADNPGLQDRLNGLPGRVFSGREHPQAGPKAVFFCYALPAEAKGLDGSGADKTESEKQNTETGGDAPAWTTEARKAAWYLYDLAGGKILERAEEIVAFVRSGPETARRVILPETELRDARLRVEKHIKNTYLKQVQAPVGVKPVLACWMELN
ncbi:MAG: DEAD/DEAH box helicase family protein [Verrucomicrobia bacterium]|jgi:superfamily II DNA or RNA helicase|nr:DEAD/DEAH box helicase family protein [Verrucomicrobiota bacterium]OQC24627.1 MAG: ATP-dependent helicase HepA [Verrucomicrobia bacterium ADurb.Bin063]HNW07864.1 helicase-related protein [Verrucomicrobiota bacterium]HNZ76117.1 helicase-related protein [Verrucomicrobiota bacterium]HOC51105.1 helicase-related protein [Verrucomicrobiota bacterium]